MYLCTYAYTIYDLYCQIWTTNESAEGQTSMNKINQWRERDIGRERSLSWRAKIDHTILGTFLKWNNFWILMLLYKIIDLSFNIILTIFFISDKIFI